MSVAKYAGYEPDGLADVPAAMRAASKYLLENNPELFRTRPTRRTQPSDFQRSSTLRADGEGGDVVPRPTRKRETTFSHWIDSSGMTLALALALEKLTRGAIPSEQAEQEPVVASAPSAPVPQEGDFQALA